MSAKPINLAAYRAARPGRVVSKRLPARLPIVVTAHPDAVAIVVGDLEFWLPAHQARDLGQDLIRLAGIAIRGAK